MLRVRVEILPGGDEKRARKVGELLIHNDGRGTERVGHYEGEFHSEYTFGTPRRATVRNFDRLKHSSWSLIGAFLKAFGHTRHSPKEIQEHR
jgi:hypothetical protein